MASRITTLLAIAVFITGCAGGGAGIDRVSKGTVAPPFVLSDLDSGQVISSVKTIQNHHATVITLWSMSCPDCREALIDVQRVCEEYSPKSVAFLGINFDRENLQGVRAFTRGEGLTFPTLWDKRQRVVRDFRALDYTFSIFVVDRNGTVVLAQYDHPPDLRRILARTLDHMPKLPVE
jgi:peroxiredoxin